MPAGTTQVRLVDELWEGGSKGGDPLAYFDHIAFNAGPCFAVPYAEDWEVGVRGWADLGGQPPTLASDATSPYGPSVQSINRPPWVGTTSRRRWR